MARMSRAEYAALYGPTTGDCVRLGDSELLAEIEHDHGVPGEECLHGGGKTLRDGIGLVAGLDSAQGSLDMLVSNAVVIDPVLGVVKGDIGIKEGLIAGVGKAGNPAVMDGVDPNLLCGAATTVRDAEGLIATPGGIDVHVHFDSAQLCEHAISSGITTMLGGSLGPITVGIDCGGAWNVGKMLQAAEAWPLNFGFLGRGNSAKPHSLVDQIAGGCMGLKIHEDWGAMPAAIRHLPRRRRRHGLPGPASHRHAERERLPGGDAGRHQEAAPSTCITPKAPAAATHPTSSASPASPTACRPPPTRPTPTRATPSTNTST